MAVSQSTASLVALMSVILTAFTLIGASVAADAPAPSPMSSAGAISPSFAVGSILTVVAFLFGSALKM